MTVSRVCTFLIVGGLMLPAADAQTLPNGVAAGDVDQSSAVLWAHSTAVGDVVFEYSRDADFADAVELQRAVTNPTIPVKVEITDLLPGTQYYYRATDAAGEVAEGAFRTPREQGSLQGLRFGVSGDSRGELRPYPSISNVPERSLDFLVNLGDTIYADVPSVDFPEAQARSPRGFRTKHNEVYTERFGVNSWRDLRESTAIFAGIDDHEVTNDFAGGAPPATDSRFDNTGEFINETQLFHNGLQAFQEYNPLRDEYYGETGDRRTSGKRKIYRNRTFGSDAAIFLLDARSFRDLELAEIRSPFNLPGVNAFLNDTFIQSRTLLGLAQLDLLLADLRRAQDDGITWKFVLVPEPIQNLSPILAGDRYEGYAFERSRILRFIDENAIDNVVFIAADIHGTVINNLTYQAFAGDRQHETSAFEVTTGPVAYAAPFGPTVAGFAPPVLQPLLGNYSNGNFVAQDLTILRLGNILLDVFDNSQIGLDGSNIDARLCRGGYIAVNSYGWTEFEIDAATQQLLITTWGIDWYTRAEMEADPPSIIARKPAVVSEFLVFPRNMPNGTSSDSGSNALEAFDCPAPKPSPCGVLGVIPCMGCCMLAFASRRRSAILKCTRNTLNRRL